MAPGEAPPSETNFTKLVKNDRNLGVNDNSTTTLSTIAVRAGVDASIVVALLKSAGYIELRVDEMKPKLLSIGKTSEETSDLLRIHEDLMIRLRDKDDQVAALLNRADGLGSEKTDRNEALVYDEMAKSLRETWRTLNRQLILRGYLLRETLQFHQMAKNHNQLAEKTIEIVKQINEKNGSELQKSIDQLINDIIDTTAAVVELGSSVITQITTLGQIDNNSDRPQEILESCLIIETIMLRVASDWEKSENNWQERKNEIQQKLKQTTTTTTIEDELILIEKWLEYAEKRVKALNENGQKSVLSEGNKHVSRLREIAQSPNSDGGRISHLSGRIEEFLHYLKTKMNRSQRIQTFLQAAKSILSQLNMMISDMQNANAAMAGELAPLAKQKTSPLISEGKEISAKEVLTHEEQRLVKQYCEELKSKLKEIEELAKQRKSAGKTTSQFSNIKSWIDGTAIAFLAQKGDMGSSLNDARDFVTIHKQFSTEIIQKDADIIDLMSKKSQMSSEEEKEFEEFCRNYEKIKDILENRIQIGNTYELVQKFGKDLEGSFDALQVLLENNQEYTNDKVASQISNVFLMIQDTLNQEKHQAEKFISNAKQIGKSDEWLNIKRAQEAVQNMIIDHENRFKYVQHKWNQWQSDKNSATKIEKTIEEIQMWQTDVLEFISKTDKSSDSMEKNEEEEVQKRISLFRSAAEDHGRKLEELKTETENEEQISRINVLVDKQDYIKNRLDQLKNKLEITRLLKVVENVQIWQEEMIEIIRNLNQIVVTKTNNQEQYEQTRQKLKDLEVEIDKKSEHLESCKTLSQNEIFQSQLYKTIEHQNEIKKTTIELQEKLETSKLVRVVQEIQMWQEEAIEIIRMLDRTQPATIQEANELIDRVHDLQENVETKSQKIREVKKLSQLPSFQQKMEEVEHVQEQIQNLTFELKEKTEQQKLMKVTEQIQMWQEEMIEIIRMFDSTPMKTIQESEELKEKVKLVKDAVEVQQPKINDVITKATDENVKQQIAKVSERQKSIRQMAENLERKALTISFELSKPQEIIEEKKTMELTSYETTKITLTPEEKKELQILKKIVEEIQIWQEEMIEIIRLIQNKPIQTIQESESVVKRISEITQTVEAQTHRLEDASRFKKDEEYVKNIEETKTKQEKVQQLVKELYERASTQNIHLQKQQEALTQTRAPQIITQLKDAEIDEGSRFEFIARIDGEPEPVINWMKDGIDVKSNIDYRQEFINGIATLVIEESFIEDTATYTVRATNQAGIAESSANLTVKSKSAMSSAILEDEKPRFVRQIQNVQVNEGETAKLDCIVVAKPEPEVTWFKEEIAIKENQRTHLTFKGDHCQMIIEQTVPLDTGIYTVRAKNIHGEVANFCQLRVLPKKQPPQAPPKPRMRAPIIQPPLTNTTWQEGETAVLQVFSHGEPKPKVNWMFNDQPIQTSNQIQITENEDGLSRLIIQQISPHNAGMYTAFAQNEVGEAVTGATVHVQSKITTTEHHFQVDVSEKISQPIQQTIVTKKNQEFEQKEHVDYPQSKEIERKSDEQRWVEVIEKHFEEHLSQKSLSPIPQITERKRIETEQRWVDKIDEIWSPTTENEIKDSRTTSGFDHYSSHNIHESTQPSIYTSTTAQSQNLSHIGQSHEPIRPYMERSTTSDETVKMMNVATVRQSPQKELFEARTTPGPTSEHVATIRKTPVREIHQTSITKAPSLENIAKIRQSPVPESHRSTITRRSPSVENVAKYQSNNQKDIHQATTTMSQPIANIAQIHNPSQPDKHGILTEIPKIDRIDDIRVIPKDQTTIKTVKQTIETTGDIDKLYQEQELKKQIKQTVTETTSGEGWIQQQHQDFVEPHKSTITVKKLNIDEQQNVIHSNINEHPVKTRISTENVEEVKREEKESKIPVLKEPKVTRTVTEETSGEGWIQQQHQDFVEPHKSTITVKKLNIDEQQNVIHSNINEHPVKTRISTENVEEVKKIEKESKIPILKEPKVTRTVTEETSGEGWIQQKHENLQQPHLSTVTIKKLEIEEEQNINKQNTSTAQNVLHTVIEEEEEEESKRRNQTRIPMKKESKTVTESTSGEGWIQHVHQDLTKPETSTIVIKKLEIDEELKKNNQFGNRPINIEMRKKTDEESSSIKQRDSFIGASDVEGFWTDGAYTASPTPPPQPIHRNTAEDNMQRIGLSRTTTEPEFIKPFEREYTIEEGGRISIECILVGNPKPSTRFFFNDRQIIEKSEFLKISHVNDTYSILISPVKLDHAGYYKLIAENKRGMSETLTILNVKPRSMQTYQQLKQSEAKLNQNQKAAGTEHTTIEEEFAMFEYEQRRPLKHETSKLSTPPPTKRIQQEHQQNEEHLETYDMEGKKVTGHPPHFTQTLTSTVIAQGDSTKFEGIVTGWPAPTVEWTLDGKPLADLENIQILNIGGRVSLNFNNCQLSHAGKYMCTAKNSSGVATSSAQLVIRPKTTAPDFIQRLISEEIEEGNQLKWTVRVTGDPMPKVTWLRDGYEIPNCAEIRIVDHNDGYHSLIIVKVEGADNGQFTCLAENIAGEARSTADLVVRPAGTQPGNYFHVTKVTQEKQSKGGEPSTSSAFSIENPRQSEML